MWEADLSFHIVVSLRLIEKDIAPYTFWYEIWKIGALILTKSLADRMNLSLLNSPHMFFDENLLVFIGFYLKKRKEGGKQLRLNNNFETPLSCVLQGSVLRAVLFSAFVNYRFHRWRSFEMSPQIKWSKTKTDHSWTCINNHSNYWHFVKKKEFHAPSTQPYDKNTLSTDIRHQFRSWIWTEKRTSLDKRPLLKIAQIRSGLSKINKIYFFKKNLFS